jgi:predicted  nucleic acid-binding Zn-ribbon protein
LYSACPTCGGPEFIFLDDAEEWVCARCRPAPAEARIIGRWTTVEAAAAKRAVTPAMFGAEKEWTDEG